MRLTINPPNNILLIHIIFKSTHQLTNKKPHECGASLSFLVSDFLYYYTFQVPWANAVPRRMPNTNPKFISVKYLTVKPTATPMTNLRNQWISLILITKSTHHPTNKKSHECGAYRRWKVYSTYYELAKSANKL